MVWDMQAALNRMGGEKELLIDMAEIFVEDSVRLVSDFEDALSQRNAEESTRCVHSLRGMCLNFGARDAAESAQAVELLCSRNELGQASDLTPHMEQQISTLRHALRDWLRTNRKT